MSGKRKALKVLGILQVIFGLGMIVGAFLANSSMFDLKQFLTQQVQSQGLDTTLINLVALFTALLVIAAIWLLIVGILMLRAAKNPEKSTVIYVLVIIDLVVSVLGIISSVVYGSFSASTLVHVIFIAVVFWLIMSIRKEARQIEI